MTQLVDRHGKPLVSNQKEKPPVLGERFSVMNEPVLDIMNLPGGGAIGFNLDALTLSDFRQMKDHYQINNSLAILTFMLHQLEWHVECENKKLIPFYEEMLAGVWSRLVRGMSQSFWAGYSPNVLEWENDVQGRRIALTDVKDLRPENSLVNWKKVDGWAPPGSNPPKVNVYDGIKQAGAQFPIPVSNTFWYPLLMENSNYYGKKLLRSAFQPWFFSQLIHLFSNRYFERFGEPVPVGRAPYDETIDINGKSMAGNVLMAGILQQLRNRSTVVLPNDRTQIADENNPSFDYSIEYLESQMRGADFERYMTRLDEEMSLALFTPILMMRTADVGSYNLGQQHGNTYDLMINAIGGDWAFYINKYILRPLRNYNDPAGANGPLPKIRFTKLGKVKSEVLQAIITQLMKGGKAAFNLREIGEHVGLTIEEIRTVTGESDAGDPAPNEDPDGDQGGDGASAPSQRSAKRAARNQAQATAADITHRIAQQVRKAFAAETFGVTFAPSMGYRRRMEEALSADGISNSADVCGHIYNNMDQWLNRVISLGPDEFGDPETFISLFNGTLLREIESVQ